MAKEIIAVTNRTLCCCNFQQQIKRLAQSGITAIILREKALSDMEYGKLSLECMQTLTGTEIPLIINQKIEVAQYLKIKQLHLSYQQFQQEHLHLKEFERVFVSVHSMGEAMQAWKWGADSLIVGHIFATDCKKGVPSRGVAFLEQICQSIPLPIYAIGGINAETWLTVQNINITGVCVMSQAMKPNLQENFFWQKN